MLDFDLYLVDLTIGFLRTMELAACAEEGGGCIWQKLTPHQLAATYVVLFTHAEDLL